MEGGAERVEAVAMGSRVRIKWSQWRGSWCQLVLETGLREQRAKPLVLVCSSSGQ